MLFLLVGSDLLLRMVMGLDTIFKMISLVALFQATKVRQTEKISLNVFVSRTTSYRKSFVRNERISFVKLIYRL